MFGQDPLGIVDFLIYALTDPQFFKLDVADAALASAIFELVWRGQSEFVSNHCMSDRVFWISRQKCILLLRHYFLYRLVNELEGNDGRCGVDFWEGIFDVAASSGTLLTLWVALRHLHFQIVVKSIDVILKPSKRRGWSFPLRKGWQRLQRGFESRNVSSDRFDDL